MRAVAERLAEALGRPAQFAGTESPTALLADAAQLCAELGPPATALDSVIRWTADWVARGGPTLGKPTHFDVRDGQF